MDNQPTAPVAAAAPLQVPAVPTTWPGAFGVFKHAKAVVKVNAWPILGLSILNIVLTSIDQGKDDNSAMGILGLIGLLLSLWVNLALIVFYIAGVKNEKLGFLASFKQSGPFYLRSLGVTILSGLILAVSLVALIVPFFFVLPRLVLANYFLVERNVGVIEALNLSWKETKGYSLKVWGIIGVTMLFAVLCLVLVGLYLLFFYQAAFVVLYYFMKKHSSTADATTAPVQSAPAAFSQAPAAPTPPVAPTVTDATAPAPFNPVPPVSGSAPQPVPPTQQPAPVTPQNPTPPSAV